ncbi:hypothetical protein OUZ56_029631 [Daphnia magna]|uniref:Uncharacterized protein n=1 Tax=Daphnia magna TaxID=35525 RepID=A0ABR0B7D7_9CRUS|nr:hypothetical protein OUZ56_029631 [Daphnia magna]
MKSQVAQVVVAKAMQKLSPEKHNGVARPTQFGQPKLENKGEVLASRTTAGYKCTVLVCKT